MSTVSICLLTYNRAQWLPRTIRLILDQSFHEYELIINDNGSMDETEQVCKQFVSSDGRCHYFRNENNLGVIGNYQTAFERTSGDYVAFLHDNDLFRPDLLAKWVAALNKYPTAAFVFNAMQFIDFNDKFQCAWPYSYPPIISPGTILLDEMLARWATSPVFGMVMVVRKCVDAVGPFDWHKFPNVGDVDMWMRLAARFDVAYIAEPLIQARIREKNHFADKWAIYEECYQIQLLNIQRRYGANRRLQRKAIQHLNWQHNYYGCRFMLGWICRGQFEKVRDAIPFWVTSESKILRIVGKILAVIFRPVQSVGSN